MKTAIIIIIVLAVFDALLFWACTELEKDERRRRDE